MNAHDDSKILKEIAEHLPYATWEQDVRLLPKIPGRLSRTRELWPRVREDETTAKLCAHLFYEALVHPHSEEELQDARTEARDNLAKEIEPVTDLPEKIRGVLDTIEAHSCHIDRPRGVEDMVLALRDSLEIVDTVIEKANV
jgi:hypothetical protein